MKSKIALVTALALVAGSAVAAEDSGFYVGAGLGIGKINVASSKITNALNSEFAVLEAPLYVTNDNVDQNTAPWDLMVGYKFMKYFAVELAYMDLGSADYTGKIRATDIIDEPIVGKAKASMNADGWPLSVLGIWPVTDQFDVWGRVGAFFGNSDAKAKLTYADGSLVCDDYACAKGRGSASSTEFVGGVGADYHFTDEWSARGEWLTIPNLEFGDSSLEGNVNTFMFSVLYTFK